MPPSSSDILFNSLRGSNNALWQSVWQHFIRDTFAVFVYDHIDFSVGYMHPIVTSLDDVAKRSRLIPQDAAAIEICSKRLVEQKDQLNSALKLAGRNEQSAKQLLKTLCDFDVTYKLMAMSTSVSEIVTFDLTSIWSEVADIIAANIHAKESSAPEQEWLLLNRLLIARFLHGCRLNKVEPLAKRLEKITSSFHGPRGGLIAIVERVSAKGVVQLSANGDL